MRIQKQNKIFYGWIIAVCCTLSVCAASLLSTGMSTNLNAMRQELGLTNTQTSLILTVRSISAFVAALFSAKFFKLLGIKRGMLVAMGCGALSFGIFTVAGTNMPLNYLAAAVAGICYSYGMMLPVSMLAKNWFNKARGSALAIASCGTGLVSIVFAPLIQSVVNNYGIKVSFLMQGGVLLAVALLILIFTVDRPEQIGLEPFGGKDWKPDVKNARQPREATHLSGFWYVGLIVATTLIGMSASPCSANYTNNLVTAGFDNMDVAKALSLYGFILIGSKLFFGSCVDRLGSFVSTMLFGVLCAIGMFLMVLTNVFVTVPFMYAAFLIIGIGCVMQTLGYPNWCADLDSRNYNRTIARCQMGYQLGAVLGSPLPGIMADASGSYAPAYVMFTLCTIAALLLVAGAYGSQRKKKD